jgi:hypothetical protein
MSATRRQLLCGDEVGCVCRVASLGHAGKATGADEELASGWSWWGFVFLLLTALLFVFALLLRSLLALLLLL